MACPMTQTQHCERQHSIWDFKSDQEQQILPLNTQRHNIPILHGDLSPPPPSPPLVTFGTSSGPSSVTMFIAKDRYLSFFSCSPPAVENEKETRAPICASAKHAHRQMFEPTAGTIERRRDRDSGDRSCHDGKPTEWFSETPPSLPWRPVKPTSERAA